MRPLDLIGGDALHLGASTVIPVPDFYGDYEAYVARFCAGDDPGRLVCIFETTEPWPMWECHPAGDEVVVVLSGRARFRQELPEGVCERIVGPHEAIVNPAGVPHTADPLEPFTALYITPAPGTTHRAR